MKKLFCLFLLLLSSISLFASDYSKKENWVICERDAKNTSYDLFYIYPTLVSSKKYPYMDWKQEKIAAKAKGFVHAQTKGIFKNDARVFAPFVRQLEYGRAMQILKKEGSCPSLFSPGFRKGMEDTKKAFLHYLEHYNKGRPFILLGHSQGAMNLLYLLHSTPQITKKRGFAAAYLPGILVTEKMFVSLFPDKRLSPAKGEMDTGCVIFWNSMNQEGFHPLFAGKDALCINPLNWKTDSTPADRFQNSGAVFYDYRTGKTERKANFCSAYIDRNKGALTVPLPSMSHYDAKGFMGKGIFHMFDVWFFAENIRINAAGRVRQWKKENP